MTSKPLAERVYKTPVEFVRVVFECGHRRPFPPLYCPGKGELFWCFQCKVRRTVEVLGCSYGVKCVSCRWVRCWEGARLKAETAASRHHQRKPGHLIVMFNGAVEVRRWMPVETLPVVGKEVLGETLPGHGGDEVPF
jgi:hypothetical protein